jgi:hypothetical protein
MTDAEIIERGRQALDILLDSKQRGTWQSWYLVAEALRVGRQQAMKEANTTMYNYNYRKIFTRWLGDSGFARLSSLTRQALFTMLENRETIEEWRQNLIDTEMFENKLNNPDYLVRKWKYRNPPKPV